MRLRERHPLRDASLEMRSGRCRFRWACHAANSASSFFVQRRETRVICHAYVGSYLIAAPRQFTPLTTAAAPALDRRTSS